MEKQALASEGNLKVLVREEVAKVQESAGAGATRSTTIAERAGLRKEFEVLAEEVREGVRGELEQAAGQRAGALLAVRSTRTKIGHLVRISGHGIHPGEWETYCGWKFAHSAHQPCAVAEVNCTRRRGACLAAARQVGCAAAAAESAARGSTDA